MMDFAIVPGTWQILYFQDCNNDCIGNFTKRAWNWTRETIDLVANEAADNTCNHTQILSHSKLAQGETSTTP